MCGGGGGLGKTRKSVSYYLSLYSLNKICPSQAQKSKSTCSYRQAYAGGGGGLYVE